MLLRSEVEELWEILIEAEISEEILRQDKCTKQLALSAARNVKFHLSQPKVSQFFVVNAIEKRSDSDSLGFRSKMIILFFYYFLYL